VFRRIVTAIIVVPLAVIIVAFTVANRQWVTVSFDPFSSRAPRTREPAAVRADLRDPDPGVIIGGIAAWIRQGKCGARRGGWKRGARAAR